MADDVNKSRNPIAPNSTLTEEIRRLREQLFTPTASERAAEDKIMRAQDIYSTGSEAVGSLPEKFRSQVQRQVNMAEANLNRWLPSHATHLETKAERYTEIARNEVRRSFNVNGQISDVARSSAGQQRALNYLNTPYADLEGRRGAIDQEIADLEKSSVSKMRYMMGANPYLAGKAQQALGMNESRKQSLVMEAGGLEAGMKGLKDMGLGPTLLRAATEAVEKAFKDLADAGEGASQALKDAAKAAEDNYNAVKGGGGGGGFGKWGKGAGQLLTLGGEIGREIFLGQTNTITGNRTTAAALTNNLFDRRRAALAGDMTQLTMLSSGAFEGAQNEGGVNKGSSRWTDIAMGVGGVVGGAALSLTGVGAAAGVPAALAGLAGLAGMAYGGTKLVNVARGADSTQEKLAEEQRQIQLAEEMAHVPGAMRQRLYDFSMGTRSSALLAGGAAGARFLEQNTGRGGAANLQRMQDARIGTEQFNALTAQGFGEQGSVFNANQVFAARNLERGGFGSMGQNMARAGALAQAGSNNPQAGLQQVLEAAFTKSLDGSKALDMMVQNTAAMAATSIGGTRAGLDTTGASARILSNLINPDMPNKEMAATRAATAEQTLNDINRGIGFSYADQSGVNAIRRATGTSRTQSAVLKNLTDADAAMLLSELDKGGDTRALANKMQNKMGLGEFTTANGGINAGKLRAGLEQRSRSIFREGVFVANAAGTPGYDDLVSGRITREEVENNPKYHELATKLGQSASLKGLTTAEALTGGRAGAISADAAAKAAGGIGGTGALTDAQRVLDDIATKQFVEMTKEAKLAAEQLGGVSEALRKISEAQSGLSEKLTDQTSDKVMGAAAEAAKSFEMGASTFTIGVKDFGTVLNSFAKSIGVRVPSNNSNQTVKK